MHTHDKEIYHSPEKLSIFLVKTGSTTQNPVLLPDSDDLTILNYPHQPVLSYLYMRHAGTANEHCSKNGHSQATECVHRVVDNVGEP